jgi:DNA topoisomerase-1
MISANVGRFGPYVVHQKDFRSLKQDDVYTIPLERALEIFKEPKKFGRRKRKE